MGVKGKQWLLALAAFGIIVLLLWMPRQPKEVREANEGMELSEVDQKIQTAVSMIEGGQNPMQGIMMLREVLEEDSLNVEAHMYMGLFSVQSGQIDKAIGRFNKVIKIDPTYGDGEAYWQLATIRFEQGDYDEAIQLFGNLLEISPEFHTAHFFIGKCYEEKGDTLNALAKYEEFLPLTQDTVVIQRLGEMIEALKN